MKLHHAITSILALPDAEQHFGEVLNLLLEGCELETDPVANAKLAMFRLGHLLAIESLHSGEIDFTGEGIRRIRDKMRMTQEQFGAELGVTYNTVNRWEREHFKPSALLRTKIRELDEKFEKETITGEGKIIRDGSRTLILSSDEKLWSLDGDGLLPEGTRVKFRGYAKEPLTCWITRIIREEAEV